MWIIKIKHKAFSLIFFFFICNTNGFAQYDAYTDSQALIAIYDALGGSNWNYQWDLGTDYRYWAGVETDANGRVTGLDLNAQNLYGFFPSIIGDLTELRTFYADFNSDLQGEIPSEIGNLTKLEHLSINSCAMAGSIPAEIGNLIKLLELDLSFNQLSGTIPNSIGNLTLLQDLDLRKNNFDGSLPEEIGNLRSLTVLELAENNFTGTLTQEIGNLINLRAMNLGANNFSGEIPTSIGNLISLRHLDIRGNSFNILPTEIGNLDALQFLYASGNDFTGNLPVGLFDMENIGSLDVSHNQFSGPIPNEFGNLSAVYDLNLSHNNLNGSIPTTIGSLDNLIYLYLNNNNLTGSIPIEVGDMAKIIRFRVQENFLSGVLNFVPKTDASYNLQRNAFVFEDLEDFLTTYPEVGIGYEYQANIDEPITINVPSGQSVTLTVDDTSSPNNAYQWRKNGGTILGANDFEYTIENVTAEDGPRYDCIITNSIATRLRLIKNTVTLVIDSDFDRDGIPIDMDACPDTPLGKDVNALGCANSQLDDDKDGITNNQDQCPNTEESATVDEFGCATNQTLVNNDREALIALYNSTDGANWTYPLDLNAEIDQWFGLGFNEFGRVIRISLRGRNLNGTLPPELGQLTNLEYLDLIGNYNGLTGSIPAELGELTNLWELKISSNSFSGSIPPELGQLRNLQDMSLGGNNLSGSIPIELSQLTYLKHLSLGNNTLTGSIPKELGLLNYLEYFSIISNQISGEIPPELGSLPNLYTLDLSRNYISGSIPSELGNLDGLRALILYYNQINGSIPTELGQLNNLILLLIDNNNLTGEIPYALGQLPNLNQVSFKNNNLSGSIPTFLPELNYFDISSNKFVFEDLESTIGNQPNAIYSPQEKIGEIATIEVAEGQNYILSVNETISSNNSYQWRKDGINIDGAIQANYTVSDFSESDTGDYDCIVNNSVASNLTLTKNVITLVVEGSLSLSEKEINYFQIYPNPVDDLLYVKSNQEVLLIEVYNNLGQIILKEYYKAEIDTSTLKSGLYFIKIFDNEGNFETERFIKK